MLNKVKELISIFLLTIYTGIAFGITLNFHYCGGHLVKVSLLNIDGQVGCLCKPGNIPKDCCKDNLIVQKADTHRAAQQGAIADFVSSSIEPPPSYNISVSPLSGSCDFDFTSNGYQRSCPEFIYLLNRAFRI